MSFSIKVRHALVDADMNPSELARKIDLSPMYVHNLLRGKRRWNEETMLKVCEVLGLEIEVRRKDVGIGDSGSSQRERDPEHGTAEDCRDGAGV